VLKVGLGVGTIGLLLSGVQQEVHVVHVVTPLIVPRHVRGVSIGITPGEIPKTLYLDLLSM
jgi:hypothetical protein